MNTNAKIAGLPFDEVVDTVCDVIEVGQKFYDTLADGAQITDVVVLWTVWPRVQEIYVDRKTFVAQAKDFTLAKLGPAFEAAAARLGTTPGAVSSKFAAGFRVLTRVNNLVGYNISEAKAIALDAKMIFGEAA